MHAYFVTGFFSFFFFIRLFQILFCFARKKTYKGDRERDRQTDRQTDNRDRQTESETKSQGETERETETERDTDRETETQRDALKVRLTMLENVSYCFTLIVLHGTTLPNCQ